MLETKEKNPSTKTIPGFFKHREHEDRNLDVLRSSALFYVLQSSAVQTELFLFNYWIIKREISDLTLVITLRDMSGRTVYAKSSPLDFLGARTLRITDLLNTAKLPSLFEGSVEVEVFSKVNLAIPYPAIIARYYGHGWHSTVHSYSRILAESSGDGSEKIESLQETSEGNWTVSPDPYVESFYVIHNGSYPVPPNPLMMTLINSCGQRLEIILPDMELKPYETRVIYPHRHMDIAGHLKGSAGTLEVRAVVSNVFPRMLCGSRRLTDGALTVDHSNFNYIGDAGAADTLPMDKAGSRKPLGFIVPTLADSKWACYADIYPTYPDRNYTVKLRVHSMDGREVAESEIMIGTERSPGLTRIPVSDLIRPYSNGGALDIAISHASRIPRRFHMGIHYTYSGGLPAYLIDGPFPYEYTGCRSRWFPVLETSDTRSYLFLSNQIFDTAVLEDIVYKVSIHNSRGDKPLSTELRLGVGATLACLVSDIVPNLKSFLGNEAGWVFMQSYQPSHCVVHYLILKGENSIAADHAF